MKKKTRQANMELLRIIAMLMVVILHYLSKGQAIVPMSENTGVLNLTLWFVEALCIVTINLYILISGYFLLDAEWKISRLITLWFQVMFYSLGVPVICLVLGIGEVNRWGVYDWVNVLFPVQMEHYWFITAYVVLYLLIPALSMGVKKMNKRQHRMVIVGLLLVFSIPKSILPIGIPTDRFGYDFGWFLCLFMIVSYIRIYGISFLCNKCRAFGIYLGAIVGIWGLSFIYGMLSQRGFPFTYAADMPYCYNHILVLIAAVALFCMFRYIEIPEGRLAAIICRISPYTLGVYLLHENLAVRTQWQILAGIPQVRGNWEIFLHMIITVFAVFIAGVMVDFVRDCIFKIVLRVWNYFIAGKAAKIERV